MTKKKKSQSTGVIPKAPSFAKVKLAVETTAGEMEAALDDQHHLQFVVKWTKSRPLVLMSLLARIGAGGLETELLTHPLGGNSGELTADMGVYAAGDITIRFVIGALTDIKQAATFVLEDTTRVTPFKPAATDPLKSLKQGETWTDNGKFTVGKASS
jgi:hypothetical protein